MFVGVLLRDETPARRCTGLFLKASLCSSTVVHAPLSPPPFFSRSFSSFTSPFPRFFFLTLLVFHSTVKAKGGLDTSGWEASGRPAAGDLSMSGSLRMR